MAIHGSEDRSGHGLLDLDTVRMLHDAVSLDHLHLHNSDATSPAKKALETTERCWNGALT